MTRPTVVTVVVGTRTEIGKTWLAAQLLSSARRRGLTVAARKPVQSYDPQLATPTDADLLATASGEHPDVVCPRHRWYPIPMAPPMAADVLGQPQPTLTELIGEVAWPTEPCDLGLVETVGGVRSPLATDGDSRDLARAVSPDNVAIVADADLGTINDVRLAAEALAGIPLLVFLNRFDPQVDLHVRNQRWLRNNDGLRVETDVDTTLASLYDNTESSG